MKKRAKLDKNESVFFMVVSVFSTPDIQYLQVYNFVLIIHLQSGKEGSNVGIKIVCMFL